MRHAAQPAILTALCLVAAATLGAAQPHPGGVMMGAGYPRPTDHNFLQGHYLVDKQSGKLATLVDTVGGKNRPFYYYFSTMDLDNRGLVVATGGYKPDPVYNLTNGVYHHDLASGAYTTLAYSVQDFQFIFGATADQDGEYYFSAWGLPSARWSIYRTAPGGIYTTALTTVQLGYRLSLHYPMVRDVDTGDLLVCTEGSVVTSVIEHPVYRLSPDGSVSTWNLSNHGALPSLGITQEIETGDLLWELSNEVFRLSAGKAAKRKEVTFYLGQREFAYGMVFENQSAAAPRLITYAVQQLTTGSRASLMWIDPKNGYAITRTLPFITASSFVPVPYQYRHIGNFGDRYLQTARTGARRWEMRFNFPTHPGQAYVAAASLLGVRPGLTLPDGRRIWLNLDPLFMATLGNLIPAVWNPGPRTLDKSGRARGFIDLGSVPALGISMHMVAAVLDAQAPHGVAFITEPLPFRL